MATLAVHLDSVEEAFNPNAVKVVRDAQGNALYFSRATIPWDRERFAVSRDNIGDHFLRHIGIYGYRAGFIRRYVRWQASPLEQIELLEQLRVLWYGEKFTLMWRKRFPAQGWIWQKICYACALPCSKPVARPRQWPQRVGKYTRFLARKVL